MRDINYLMRKIDGGDRKIIDMERIPWLSVNMPLDLHRYQGEKE